MRRLGVHYDSFAGYRSDRKTIASTARMIAAEENGGVDQVYFSKRFVQDNEHSLAFFKKVCKNIGNLKGRELAALVDDLKKTINESEHVAGQVYHFDGDEMYRVLTSNEICRGICEAQGYNNWNDIIARFC